MPLVEAEVKGQKGWYDETNQEFLPATDWAVGEHQGKTGLFNSKTNEFQSTDTSLAPPKMPDQSLGGYLRGLLAKASPYYRPVLEYGGMMGGSMAGGSPVTPTGIAAGALGYAGGKSTANVLDQIAGVKQPKDFLTEVSNTGKDVVQGTEDMMGGPIIGKMLGAGGKILRKGAELITGEADPARWLMSKALRTPITPAWKKAVGEEGITRRGQVVDEALREEVLPNEAGRQFTNKVINATDQAVGKEVANLETAALAEKNTATKAFVRPIDEVKPLLRRKSSIKTVLDPLEAEVSSLGKLTNEDYMKMPQSELDRIGEVFKDRDRLIKALRDVDDKIAAVNGGTRPSTTPTYLTPKEKLTQPIQDLKKDAWYSKNGPKNIQELEAFEADISRMAGTDSVLTPKELHTFKQQMYRDANYERTKPLMNQAGRFSEEATKKVAHQAMTELEKMAPDVIGPLNKKEGLYLDLRTAIEDTIARYDRADIAGFGAKVLAMKNLGLAALEMVTGTPAMKARLAIALKHAQKADPNMGKGLMMFFNREKSDGSEQKD